MPSATRTRLACLLSVANDRPTMADALADIGRTPTQDWLLSDKLDEQLKRWKAEDAERAMFTDDYGRSL